MTIQVTRAGIHVFSFLSLKIMKRRYLSFMTLTTSSRFTACPFWGLAGRAAAGFDFSSADASSAFEVLSIPLQLPVPDSWDTSPAAGAACTNNTVKKNWRVKTLATAKQCLIKSSIMELYVTKKQDFHTYNFLPTSCSSHSPPLFSLWETD